ncbi:hypothetical protein PoB_000367700 [Plakobranchus ocellatus]|uniref:Uncharacterized protein n=1 Tax=Plakobranchus ocellatus TaxID=259542 RepID=A0AAV3Y3Y6_9GAST|nr:hypothetical protein PoB_000367700 [Plakobranchus ocellatus]
MIGSQALDPCRRWQVRTHNQSHRDQEEVYTHYVTTTRFFNNCTTSKQETDFVSGEFPDIHQAQQPAVQVGYIRTRTPGTTHPQQDDFRLSDSPSDRSAGGGARTRDRIVPEDLKADSLATVPPTHQEQLSGGP